MPPELLIALSNIIDGFSSRRAQGHTLTEDEVLVYNQTCNLVRSWGRYMELQYMKELRKEEKQDDDDDSCGNPAKIAPSPS